MTTITSTIFAREKNRKYRPKAARALTPADEREIHAAAEADAAATRAGLPSYTEVSRRASLLDSPDYIIGKALLMLEERCARPMRPTMGAPDDARTYLKIHMSELDHEVFGVMYLDAQHRLIAFEVPFRGTLTQASVYPREIVRRALALNAAAVILAHNHPSGHPEPSQADEFLTKQLKAALTLVDVRVLDHIIIGAGLCTSFAERGLI